MPETDADRAHRLGPYFEVQLQLARRMAALTGASLGETTLRFTNLHRRLGFGVHKPEDAPAAGWGDYARALEAEPDPAAQLAFSQAVCAQSPPEHLPLPGQTQFGCFACEPVGDDGAVRLHFNNVDTDEAGGPLAGGKVERRRAEMAALVRHVRETWPQATVIRGKSWLYNLEAYRRLFPAEYGASRTIAPGPLRLNGTSSWGQLIDSRERVRPDVRDAFLANLESIDPATPWLVFPFRVLGTEAPIESFAAEYGL
jgi:hypothetical protein